MLGPMRLLWRKIAPQALRRLAGVLTGWIVFETTVRRLAKSKDLLGYGPPALVGFFTGASGVALSVQLASRAMDQLGIAHRRIDIGDIASPNDPGNRSASVWIFYVNPPELIYLLFRWGNVPLKGLRFGHWAWELSRAPPAWRGAVRAMDGVMAQSAYTAKSFEPERVTVTPHPLFSEDFVTLGERKARCSSDLFTVVCLFDFKSSVARKNPNGALAAFNQAFTNDPKAQLIFKTQNADLAPDLMRALKHRAGSNVKFIDAVWEHSRVLELIASADTLISLHRAEGFGLVLAEAMFLGVPVVATDWSGNLDFMDAETACLVPAKLTPVHDPQGIYRGQNWAEPDVVKAGAYLKRLGNDPDFAAAMARRAREKVTRELSPTTWFRTLPATLQAAVEPFPGSDPVRPT